ncbi:zinc finger HIT domain-containing protein 3 [Frankliniella occidentalis]|uniref:Zinc finger HIT domain-containing protein 3 n=1 Tax=Frankliniella occidentalis TaxID=133901 RepID=A0A6J1SBS0_FRAOC|nr:zinc finger HIT domain-containing protein 3 [Frankliniella occidentalis]
MSCNICNDGASKYKCPSCRIPYCSIPCWKKHKNDGCGDEVVTITTAASLNNAAIPDAQKPKYIFPTEDTVPPEKLQLLRDNMQLRNILSNPHVRTILSSLDNATNPSKHLHDAMQEPIFVEFVDECMKTLNPPTQEELDEAILQSLDLQNI